MAWQVNLALVLDGSGSISSENWELEKDFAKDVVSAFTEKDLFENGGTASYVQFDSYAHSSGSFTSQEEFNDFVDADLQSQGGTEISAGIAKGQQLLSLNDSGGAVMVVITDGDSYLAYAEAEADAARAEGTNIFAVGVGRSFPSSDLKKFRFLFLVFVIVTHKVHGFVALIMFLFVPFVRLLRLTAVRDFIFIFCELGCSFAALVIFG